MENPLAGKNQGNRRKGEKVGFLQQKLSTKQSRIESSVTQSAIATAFVK